MECEKIEGEEGRGEEKVAHELGLDGETGGVGETESTIGAAGAEEGGLTGDIENVKKTLNPTEETDDRSRDKKRENKSLPERLRGVE